MACEINFDASKRKNSSVYTERSYIMGIVMKRCGYYEIIPSEDQMFREFSFVEKFK